MNSRSLPFLFLITVGFAEQNFSRTENNTLLIVGNITTTATPTVLNISNSSHLVENRHQPNRFEYEFENEQEEETETTRGTTMSSKDLERKQRIEEEYREAHSVRQIAALLVSTFSYFAIITLVLFCTSANSNLIPCSVKWWTKIDTKIQRRFLMKPCFFFYFKRCHSYWSYLFWGKVNICTKWNWYKPWLCVIYCWWLYIFRLNQSITMNQSVIL